MTELGKTSSRLIHAESVVAGDGSSRLSSIIFLLLCVAPVFSTVLFGAVDNMTWIFISMFWTAIVLLWLAEAWKAKGVMINTSSLQLPVIGLLVIGFVQLLPLGPGDAGDLVGAPISRALSLEPYATRFFVTRLVVYFVFFAACLAFINNERRVRKAVMTVIVFGAVMAFFGILQRLAAPEGIYGIRDTPQAIPFGPFVNQHHFAAFMEMTAGVTLGLLFGKGKGRDSRLLLAIAFVLMGVATVLTSSRGGVLGFLSVFAFVALLNLISGRWSGDRHVNATQPGGVYRKVVLAAGGVALIVIIFGVVLFLGGNDSLLRGIGVSNASTDISSGRAHFWPIAISIFLEHPVLGAGFDAFGVAFTKHDTWNGLLRVEQAHNEYLQILADAGLAGFFCIAGFIYLLFRKSLATIAAAGGSERRDAAVGALAGCFGIMIHSFFDFPLRTPSNAFFFLLLAAIATVSVRSGRHRPHATPGRPIEP